MPTMTTSDQNKKPGVYRKMQNVSFNDLEEFLEFLPEREKKIVQFLRQLIHDTLPDCKEKLTYNVPYFYRRKGICFIWPSSVTWGNVKQNGVRLGFTQGMLLNDELNYMDKGGRKQVTTKDFMNIEEIDTDVVKMLLIEAYELSK